MGLIQSYEVDSCDPMGIRVNKCCSFFSLTRRGKTTIFSLSLIGCFSSAFSHPLLVALPDLACQLLST